MSRKHYKLNIPVQTTPSEHEETVNIDQIIMKQRPYTIGKGSSEAKKLSNHNRTINNVNNRQRSTILRERLESKKIRESQK